LIIITLQTFFWGGVKPSLSGYYNVFSGCMAHVSNENFIYVLHRVPFLMQFFLLSNQKLTKK